MNDELTAYVVEMEAHVAEGGWDQPPRLFALVDTAQLATREPQLAATLAATTGRLTPVEQEELPAGELDEVLAGIAWPAEVQGAALVTEVVMLPPDIDAEPPPDADVAAWAAAQPGRRDVRLAVAVLRDGTRASCLRIRGAETEDELLVGDDLVPNLADALHATLLD